MACPIAWTHRPTGAGAEADHPDAGGDGAAVQDVPHERPPVDGPRAREAVGCRTPGLPAPPLLAGPPNGTKSLKARTEPGRFSRGIAPGRRGDSLSIWAGFCARFVQGFQALPAKPANISHYIQVPYMRPFRVRAFGPCTYYEIGITYYLMATDLGFPPRRISTIRLSTGLEQTHPRAADDGGWNRSAWAIHPIRFQGPWRIVRCSSLLKPEFRRIVACRSRGIKGLLAIWMRAQRVRSPARPKGEAIGEAARPPRPKADVIWEGTDGVGIPASRPWRSALSQRVFPPAFLMASRGDQRNPYCALRLTSSAGAAT